MDESETRANVVNEEGCCYRPKPPPLRKRGGGWSIVSAILLVLMPKCPMCVAAYLGLVGMCGTGSFLKPAWGLPLSLAFLAVPLVVLIVRALGSGKAWPLFLGTIGGAVLLCGRHLLASPALQFVGLVLLMTSLVWKQNARCDMAVLSQPVLSPSKQP
jgi:hypothetical protein